MAAKVPEEKIADCRELYLRYGGAGHVRIAAEMRARGWRGFTKRNLYARTRGGRVTPGWPERFGWDREIGRQGEKEKGRRGTRGCAPSLLFSLSPFLRQPRQADKTSDNSPP